MESSPEARRLRQATNDIEALYDLMSETRKRLEDVASTVTEHSAQLAAIETKLVEHDQRFDRLDQRFEGIDKRFNDIDQRFGQIDTAIGSVRSDVREILTILRSR